jgi:hypothetical protein|tara:strand:- start:671 stop:2959 length:2289 start_codon:yes stop_codon:yes gene_type:complete
MTVKSSKLRVAPLRGMDQRWRVKPTHASSIIDMTWSDQDSWMRAGGFEHLCRDYTPDDWLDVGTNTSFTSQVETSESQVGDGPFTQTSVTNTFTSSVVTNPYTTGSRVALNAYNQETDSPISLHWFAQHSGGLQWLVYETTKGKLRYFNGSRCPIAPWTDIYYIDGKAMDGTNYPRKVVNTPWIGTQFCTFASRLYMVNGFNFPLVFDGRKATRLGFATSPNGLSVGDGTDVASQIDSQLYFTQRLGVGTPGKSGSGNTRQSTYAYKISFVNERGQESPLSPIAEIEFDAQGSDGSRAGEIKALIDLNIPLGPEGTVARNIYRTQNLRDASGDLRTTDFSALFFFHSQIQDNVTEAIIDAKPDDLLGSVVDELDFGVVPHKISMIALFKGRSFVAKSDSNIIHFSRANFPEVFPEDNVIDLSDTSGSRITALYSFNNSLVVFKDRGIYLIKGDTTDGLFAQPLSRDIGCIASNSVRFVPGLGLVFLASEGLFCLEGTLEDSLTRTSIVKLSTSIRDLIHDINFAAIENCRSIIYHRDREYWLCVPILGSSRNTRVIKFSYEIGAFSLMDNMPIKAITESEDHRGHLFFAGAYTDSTEGPKGLFVYTRGFLSKGGYYDLDSQYETSNIPFGSVYENFVPVRVQSQVIGYGNNDLKMNFTTNRELSEAYTTDKTSKQKRPLEDKDISVYGTTTWGGGGLYAQHRPVYARFDINTMHKGPVNEVRIKFTPTSGRIELLEFQMEARIGSRRNVINLTEKMGGTETR